MYRKAHVWRYVYKFFFPLAHFIAAPAYHRVFVYRQRAIGHDKIGIKAYYTSEAFTPGAGAVRIVEVEHGFRWFAKSHAVGFKML